MRSDYGYDKSLARQIAWFVLVGTVGFVVDAGGYLLFANVLGWPSLYARLAAFLPATAVTWALNRAFSFTRKGAPRRGAGAQYLRYLSVQGAGIAINFAVFVVFMRHWPALPLAGLALGSVAAIGFNFAGSRLLVFSGARHGLSSAARPLLALPLFGLASVLLGQDANWDLANYHLYNPHALLNGRIGLDLAPAGLQSYFNPLLDIPYYWMAMNLPPRAVAFAMGALHGLNLLAVVGIVRLALPQADTRQAFLLALAGCLGATFLSELGNTMGDASTAPLVLAAVWICLRAPGQRQLALAGLLVGVACGLKLTNAVYAVGLFCALGLLPGPWRGRMLAGLVFGVAVLAGIALTSGYWFARMWTEFGNPLFPQFNAFFGSPLAAPINVADTRWRPTGLGEALLFPFVFTVNPRRVGETPLVQLLWPAAYTLFFAWAAMAGLRRTQAGGVPTAQRMLLAFVGFSYLTWLVVFSIGRYTVAMELLLPLVVWLLSHRLLPAPRAVRLAWALVGAALTVGLVRFNTWGNVPFGEKNYDVRPPAIAQPERATVLMLTAPVAWMVPFFPHELAFVSIGQFPESEGYRRRAAQIMHQRGGDVWAILPVASHTLARIVESYNAWVRGHELQAGGRACSAVHWLMQRSARYRVLLPQASAVSGGLCLFELPPSQRRDLPAENIAIADRAAADLASRGLRLEATTCTLQHAFIGARDQPYQFCRVSRPGAGARP